MQIVDRRRTADGFLATKGRISKTGIYDYLRGELGLDGDPREVVKIYRPEDAVFSDESMASAAHRPLTLNHPPVFVDASNWKKYGVGHTGGKVRRDGEHVDVDMLILDGAAIDAVEHGAELSPGYTANISIGDGQTPEGEHYDGVMEGPYHFNHIAVLTGKGRGGATCRLGDAWPIETQDSTPKKEARNMKIVYDGLTVDLSDEGAANAFAKKLTDAAAAAEQRAETAEKALTDAQAATATAATEAATAVQAKDAEIETLKAAKATLETQLADASSPEKLKAAAAAYAKVVDQAKALGATVADGASEADIKKSVVSAKLGDVAAAWTDAQVDVSFNTLAASAPVTDALRQSYQSPTLVQNMGDEAAKARTEREKMIADMNPETAAAK